MHYKHYATHFSCIMNQYGKDTTHLHKIEIIILNCMNMFPDLPCHRTHKCHKLQNRQPRKSLPKFNIIICFNPFFPMVNTGDPPIFVENQLSSSLYNSEYNKIISLWHIKYPNNCFNSSIIEKQSLNYWFSTIFCC